MTRDRAPIDQAWVQRYCDEFLKVAPSIPEGSFRDAILRRVECCMDLLESWQLRNVPIDQREKEKT
jgi:hypothetical protein